MPTVEANASPVEGSARGTIVADASLPYLGIGLLRTPVRATVEDGMITAIEGGAEAERFAAQLAAQGDPACYNVAEVGIGLNPSARLCGWMLEDEGVLGVVHIGIGSSIQLGGVVAAPTHYDLLMRGATLTVDDVPILRDGEVVLL